MGCDRCRRDRLLPILMVTWFAQLVAWHGQPVGKALFFSFFACWRNRWPFLMLQQRCLRCRSASFLS